MKTRLLPIFLFAFLLASASAALAAPQLSGVFADDIALVSGVDGWFFDFNASEGGTMALQLLSGETGEAVADLGAAPVEAGSGRMAWNGLLPDGTSAPSGSYMMAVQLKNFWGEESEQAVLSLQIYGSEQEMSENRLDLSTLVAQEAAVWEESGLAGDPIEEKPAVPAGFFLS